MTLILLIQLLLCSIDKVAVVFDSNKNLLGGLSDFNDLIFFLTC